MKKLGLSIVVVAAGLALVAPASGHDGRRRHLKASLKGFNENPTLSTTGHGTFRAVINDDDTAIEYHLNYADLMAPVLQSHIHLGAVFVNGGVSVFLCGTTSFPGPAGTPTCPATGAPGDEATGTITAASVIGPTGQGIAPGEFAELIKAIRAGVTYANVHTTQFPGGEIRGQIHVED
jgi:hypothetical protein